MNETGLNTISVSDNGCGITREGPTLLDVASIESKEFGGSQSVCGKALDTISTLAFVTIETSADESDSGFQLRF